MFIKSSPVLLPSLLAVMMFSAGCDKDPSPTPTPSPTPLSRMSAKINGSAFYAAEFTLTSTDTIYTISGSTDNVNRSTAISFNVRHYAGLSTYPIDTSVTATFTQLGIAYPVVSGAITITTDNAIHSAGTFNLQALAGGTTKNITESSFDIYK